MSPLARSLLALAAAALLHRASAIPNPQCTTVVVGSVGISDVLVSEFTLDQTDSVVDLPPDNACAPLGRLMVGLEVTSCDPFGNAPSLEPLELLGGYRVRITCARTDGQQCPKGIVVTVRDLCDYDIK